MTALFYGRLVLLSMLALAAAFAWVQYRAGGRS